MNDKHRKLSQAQHYCIHMCRMFHTWYTQQYDIHNKYIDIGGDDSCFYSIVSRAGPMRKYRQTNICNPRTQVHFRRNTYIFSKDLKK